MHGRLTQISKDQGVGGESVFDDDDRQIEMLLAEPLSSGGSRSAGSSFFA